MKHLLLLVTTLISSNIFANPFNFQSPQQGFEQVKSMFDSASLPTNPNKLIGWTSGRCFSNESTDNSYGVLLIGLSKKNTDGSVVLDKIFTMTNIGGRPEAFDRLSAHVSSMIESSLDEQLLAQMKPLSIQNNALTTGLIATPEFLESSYEVRESENGISFIHGQQGSFEEWCYAFKKVR